MDIGTTITIVGTLATILGSLITAYLTVRQTNANISVERRRAELEKEQTESMSASQLVSVGIQQSTTANQLYQESATGRRKCEDELRASRLLLLNHQLVTRKVRSDLLEFQEDHLRTCQFPETFTGHVDTMVRLIDKLDEQGGSLKNDMQNQIPG